ncbi:hypothetical protein [Thalassospira sp. MCCC 1A01428]|mgnify:FL=1|uniref:Cap15 family cyclic dinucleotide receptor domain-containing protein n=1 Tax=Thalassospira sp. MCCC 1A01428 TaxID=1470575 RepID=UPI000A1E9DBA|nr:hypothetical protein [Thalassospira sp. MCCC 1A01428]OSQ37600.1 hypothetical protein THS27_22665 [Thalassospira sp. MCCC 1A01428]|tara:strand:+ start:256 stop:879 length:624 start_codon:yes stop_codon:yes gene_type:complete
MRQDHEYSVIGHSRAKIGRILGTIAAAVSSATVLLAGLASDFASQYISIPPIVLWPLTASAVFFVVHWAFNKFVWRWKWVVLWLKIPNLNGQWDCQGQTCDLAGNVTNDWQAIVTITQSWEKIWVHLQTGQSASFSISAALIRMPNEQFRLLYSYQNEPRMGEPELQRHVGFAELMFSADLQSADGEYFNSKGRYTFGRMHLTKEGN